MSRFERAFDTVSSIWARQLPFTTFTGFVGGSVAGGYMTRDSPYMFSPFTVMLFAGMGGVGGAAWPLVLTLGVSGGVGYGVHRLVKRHA